MDDFTTITVSKKVRELLGKKCPKDLSFSQFLEKVLQ